MTLQLRPATTDDASAAAAVLADAFTDYPWTRWTVAAADHTQRLTALQHLYLTAVALPFGHVDVGSTDGSMATVAVWISSTGVPEHVWAEVAPAAAELAGDRAAAAEAAEAVLALRRPTDEHLLLACVGVARAHQRQGLGAAAVAPGLARADQEGVAVHLETSEARNLRFYHRLGFTITDVVDLPDGGPRTWLMRREPSDAVRS
jgi:GNAT superfamily N-acetyltransferase